MVTYNNNSPFSDTNLVDDQYLDILNIRPIPATGDDVVYTIEVQYTHRPDLLAYDIYGNSKLWWIFAQRNPDSLKDPIYDFVAGLQIYVPQGPLMREYLGL